MIPIILTIGLAVIAALLKAWYDAMLIADNVKIDHGAELWKVALPLGLIVGSVIAIVHTWAALLLIPMCWATFTPVFRWALNKRRSMVNAKIDFDWRYVAPFDAYDKFFVWALTGETLNAKQHHDRYFTDEDYAKGIHAAGLWMYRTELTVWAISLALFTYYTFKP